MKWAVLVPAVQRPAILNEKHTDFIWGLRWIPRSWTSFIGYPPKKLYGTAPTIFGYRGTYFYPKPIPDKAGEWWIGSPPYFAWRITSRWYLRVGFRWDDNDMYYALSFTIKRFDK